MLVTQYALEIKRSDLGTSKTSLKDGIQMLSFLFQLLGCVENNMFRNEDIDHQLRTLNTKWPRRANLSKQNCAVNISTSWYVGCHGEKLPIAEPNPFSLKWNYSRPRCDLTVQNITSTDIFRGRVINLGINEKNTACLLFKLEGHITCAVNKTPSMVPAATSSPTIVKSKTLVIVPTATSTLAIVTESPSAPFKIFPEKTNQPTTDPPQAVSKPSTGNKQKRVGSSSRLGVIIGVTVSIATVLVLIAAIFFYRRHNSRNATRTSAAGPNKKKMLGKTNEALQPEAQEGYVTSSNRRPRTSLSGDFYASLNVPKGHNIYGPDNADEPFYNVLQEPSLNNEEDGQHYGSLCLDPPVYQALKDPKYPGNAENKGATITDPVYNVLEEPFAESSHRSERYGTLPVNEPFYNTLEQPQSNDGPKRTSDEPVHNTLEDPYDNGAGDNENYGSMGLQDPVYNVLEGPGTDEMEAHISDSKNIPLYAVVNKKEK